MFYESENLMVNRFSVVYRSTVCSTKVTVKGKITDEHNEPVIGANIMEKGTTNGVISDFDGFLL